MPIIELGELGPGPASEAVRAADGRSGGAAVRSVRRRRDVRRTGAAAVLVGSLAIVAAGEPVPRPLPELTVPARLGATVHAVGDWLFVADPLEAGTQRQELAAYRIPDDAGGWGGRDELAPRWRIVLPAGEVGALTMVGATLVFSTRSYRDRAALGRVTALDLTSGAVRWSREAYLEVVNPAGQLLLSGTADPSVDPATPLRAVDPVSGEVRWSLPGPAGVRRHYPWLGGAAPPTMVVVEPSGRVESRDTGTGALISATRLPSLGDPDEPRWYGAIAGELFLVRERGRVTAYEMPGLDRRWSVTVDDNREYGPGVCGPDLCTHGRDGGVRVLDAATGGIRWSSDRWARLHWAGDEPVGIGPVESAGPAPLSVLDADTGRSLADLGSWQILDTTEASSRFVAVRVDADRRAWVAEIDVPSRRVRPLGVLSGVSDDCALIRRWLHCRRVDASVGLWRLPGGLGTRR
ncbi:hypothetical protein [Plantactinospora sp. B5E13]|uniref:hypothetical protein n=1 Tax=Plantactinospora sp. B5E13 TaxID=3153758 RepID=UPI00325F1F8C